MVLSALMAIQAAQVDTVPIPAGVMTFSGLLDVTYRSGMQQPCQATWEGYANPHELTGHFKPSPAIPELTLDNIHPYLRKMEDALHPLASPIACPDELFRSFPPILMLMGDGDFFCKDLSILPRVFELTSISVFLKKSVDKWRTVAILFTRENASRI